MIEYLGDVIIILQILLFFFYLERLHGLGLSWSDVVNMNVFIKNMDEFGRMNAIYKKFFHINPPTR